jgi:hypothetical protein
MVEADGQTVHAVAQQPAVRRLERAVVAVGGELVEVGPQDLSFVVLHAVREVAIAGGS